MLTRVNVKNILAYGIIGMMVVTIPYVEAGRSGESKQSKKKTKKKISCIFHEWCHFNSTWHAAQQHLQRYIPHIYCKLCWLKYTSSNQEAGSNELASGPTIEEAFMTRPSYNMHASHAHGLKPCNDADADYIEENDEYKNNMGVDVCRKELFDILSAYVNKGGKPLVLDDIAKKSLHDPAKKRDRKSTGKLVRLARYQKIALKPIIFGFFKNFIETRLDELKVDNSKFGRETKKEYKALLEFVNKEIQKPFSFFAKKRPTNLRTILSCESKDVEPENSVWENEPLAKRTRQASISQECFKSSDAELEDDNDDSSEDYSDYSSSDDSDDSSEDSVYELQPIVKNKYLIPGMDEASKNSTTLLATVHANVSVSDNNPGQGVQSNNRDDALPAVAPEEDYLSYLSLPLIGASTRYQGCMVAPIAQSSESPLQAQDVDFVENYLCSNNGECYNLACECHGLEQFLSMNKK